MAGALQSPVNAAQEFANVARSAESHAAAAPANRSGATVSSLVRLMENADKMSDEEFLKFDSAMERRSLGEM